MYISLFSFLSAKGLKYDPFDHKSKTMTNVREVKITRAFTVFGLDIGSYKKQNLSFEVLFL